MKKPKKSKKKTSSGIIKRLLIFLFIVFLMGGGLLLFSWLRGETTPKESTLVDEILYYVAWIFVFLLISFVTRWIIKGKSKSQMSLIIIFLSIVFIAYLGSVFAQNNGINIQEINYTQIHLSYEETPHKYSLDIQMSSTKDNLNITWSIDCGYFVGGNTGSSVDWWYDVPGECINAKAEVTVLDSDGNGQKITQSIFFPEDKQIVDITAPVKKIEQPTKGIEDLIQEDPQGLSQSAGVYTPEYDESKISTPEMIRNIGNRVFKNMGIEVNKNCKNYCNSTDFEKEIKIKIRESCAQIVAARNWLDLFSSNKRKGFKCERNERTGGITIGVCDIKGNPTPNDPKIEKLKKILKGAHEECIDGVEITCEKECSGDTDAYTWANWIGHFASIHICPKYCKFDEEDRQQSILHELTHYGDSTDDVANDDLNAHNLEKYLPWIAELYFDGR